MILLSSHAGSKTSKLVEFGVGVEVLGDGVKEGIRKALS